MSTRERAQMIFDQLTDEELAGFVALFEHRITVEPPASVFPKNRAELKAMLEEAEEDIRAGRVYTEEEANSICGRNSAYEKNLHSKSDVRP